MTGEPITAEQAAAIHTLIRAVDDSGMPARLQRDEPVLWQAIDNVRTAFYCRTHDLYTCPYAHDPDTPGVVPACAGRSNSAHPRTLMLDAPFGGHYCPVCGLHEPAPATGSEPSNPLEPEAPTVSRPAPPEPPQPTVRTMDLLEPGNREQGIGWTKIPPGGYIP